MVLSIVDHAWNISSSHSCCLDLVVLYLMYLKIEISSSILSFCMINQSYLKYMTCGIWCSPIFCSKLFRTIGSHSIVFSFWFRKQYTLYLPINLFVFFHLLLISSFLHFMMLDSHQIVSIPIIFLIYFFFWHCN